ncbi:DUF3710 domain-containing protein [Actinacidiphila bryophytorum]|uniref:DUF3710 domain-containing protein n=1 Tax=Actinacidiphila bryophytorum TaxID=1436133 RepID=UPI002176B6E4|nr:DUF3710 domain-containing protein [Actinacidiphila bryophytorum]UWE08220.1 DUF3710 domain-containing protein [Actinacidiphila bryophytorum]
MREFERSGVLSPAAQEAAGFGEWSRLTPAGILFGELKLEVLARQEAGEAAEGIAGRLGGSLTGDAATRLVRAVMGDMREVGVPAEQSVVTLQNVVAMLSAAWADDGIGDADIDLRLAAAEDLASDSVRLMAGAAELRRGGGVGPWDIGELGDAVAGRVDLGGLLVPVPAGIRLDPVAAGADGPVVAITLFGETSALQLQAYRARPERPWDVVRGQLCRSVTAYGGSAAECAGPAGLEVRALQPVVSEGSPQTMNVRFVGCDGPGWLLRGTVSGQGAEPESFGSWPYEVFRETVVNAEFAHVATTDFIPLRWPPER